MSLLEKFGIETKEYAQSSTLLTGLDASDYAPWKEQAFDSWAKIQGNRFEVRGRLRMSDNLDEAKLFYLDVQGQESVMLEVNFQDFHRYNVAYHCGTPVTLVGTGNIEQRKVTKIESLESVFGHKPGSAGG